MTLAGCENKDLFGRCRRRQSKPAAGPGVQELDVDTKAAYVDLCNVLSIMASEVELVDDRTQ
jgi:hypothetical protein